MASSHLHKFGGSSLADADCYRRVAHILLTHGHSDDLIVVSAAGKTTNHLYKLLAFKASGDLWLESLQDLISFQQNLIEQLLSNQDARELRERLSTDKAQLTSLLSLTEMNVYQRNQVVSFGERWSARLMAALLSESGVAATHLDAASVLVADEGVVPQIRVEESKRKLSDKIVALPDQRIVITGFICANEQGDTLLLGRNGSDYSATLIASLADISRVTIWTDVEGVFNADPNKTNDAKLLSSLSLSEADRLANLGSPVLHSRTLQPLFDTQVSLAVRSSYASHTDFTLITPTSDSASAPVVTNLDTVSLFRVKLAGDLEGFLSALNLAAISPLAFWSQASQRVELAFTPELQPQVEQFLRDNQALFDVSLLEIVTDMGLVALVSSDAKLYHRSFARLLSRDAKALYSDALSLVTLVPKTQVNLLTQKVHRRCAGPRKRIGLLLLGLGNIGEAWIQLFKRSQAALNQELEASVELVGLISSQRAWLSSQQVNLGTWQDEFEANAKPWEYVDLFEELQHLGCDEYVALDISASGSLSLQYPAFFERGIHIVSANKLAGSGPLVFYKQLKQQLGNRRLFWRYNASCGAGLPVQHALNDLHNSGDRVEAVGGIFSGTLCWLFEHFDGSKPFSELVLEAKALGITEPDPRDDLSGRDMQRKLLILAREIGLDIELDDITLNSLVPDELAQLSLDDFIAQISELDGLMQQQFVAAQEQDKVLRYVASLDHHQGKLDAKVGLEWVDASHPYANLTPGDNVFVIRSAFYQGNPLIIRGPGAGREVTAAAVQSDLAQICRDLIQE
ncbi:bifunctional aspartate kinase/homoserine dehydrogenase II [Shewanella gelidii]|uniref:Bifunctional aspartokinase/homoserine dehydrogenase n=1 Tax=Shewanella gelidii TaxID=1642821 RepID=A0A917N9X2_9GAMM|nr:bifunctional aspartate kinase/homoserine dehydrogenase II [Shewanella gelidii]MCL1097612.1 bifunctional aspartate kinase/homoserine dehydrogenase II [Shewanella gelidii]GGI80199.1 bifunctional aspartate kinase/homoserine dehydrogenase II [Shewanella gelidii]